jgi:hypothetical protein
MEYAARQKVDPIEKQAKEAAKRICKNSSTIFRDSGLPESEASSIIFLRRKRDGGVNSEEGRTFIPTPHLLAIVEEYRQDMTNQDPSNCFMY